MSSSSTSSSSSNRRGIRRILTPSISYYSRRCHDILLDASALSLSSASYMTARRNSSSSSSNHVRIVEVSPRDGLQNERGSTLVSTEDKVELIRLLRRAGVKHLECGAFVSPKAVPQMSDSGLVLERVLRLEEEEEEEEEEREDVEEGQREDGIVWNGGESSSRLSVVVPNVRGIESVLEVCRNTSSWINGKRLFGDDAVSIEVAVFGSASEMFSQRNIHCSIDESLDRFRDVMEVCNENRDIVSSVRGYVSCVLGCPYDGLEAVTPSDVAAVSESLVKIGCNEISLGDTIGVGTPKKTIAMLQAVKKSIGDSSDIAVHFHDTYGQALANIYAAVVEEDIRIVDSSVGGIGGCPYAPGASGNASTEDLVYMLHGMGFDTGIDLDKLVLAGSFLAEKVLQRKTSSKAAQAILSKNAAEKCVAS